MATIHRLPGAPRPIRGHLQFENPSAQSVTKVWPIRADGAALLRQFYRRRLRSAQKSGSRPQATKYGLAIARVALP